MPALEAQKETLTFEKIDALMVRQEKLGKYFTYHNIKERFGLTFEQFVDMVDMDAWEKYITERQPQIPGQRTYG